MNKIFAGKVALVTGAASGIGRATAFAFAEHGARLALIDLDMDGMKVTLAQAGATDGLAFVVDLADTNAVIKAAHDILAVTGGVDFLANVAGMLARPDRVARMDAAVWQRTLAVNLIAPAVLTNLIGENMVARGVSGRIVNISSSSAFRAAGEVPAAYACSKAALGALTRVSAAEFGKHDINVNSVVPGPTLTAMAVRSDVAERLQEMVTEGPMANLLGRVSLPEDVASAIVFLCRPESRQITGQLIHTSAGAVV
jgi:NAD(P)-dependent dehydrogenase (short-subunit alcohol dehydrogenase family)